MNVPQLAGILSVAVLSLFVWSCDAPVEPDSEPEASAPLFRVDCAERPDHPTCDGSGGGGGGGGGEPTYTLELSGAMIASETPVEIGRDNKSALHVNGTMEVAFAFDLSGACTLNVPDGYAGDADALEVYFRNILTGAAGSPSTRDVAPLAVDKPDATGSIRLLPLEEDGDDRWVRLGDHPDVAGNLDGPGDRVLTYTGGTVRVVARLSPDTWEACSSTVPCKASDPISGYVCPGESVVAILRESP